MRDQPSNPDHSPQRRTIARAWRDRGGNVAVMTAFILPVLVTATLGGVSLTMALSKRQELNNIVQLACNRAIKPTRMKIGDDAERTARAEAYLRSLASQRKITLTEASVTSDWLTAEVKAKATIPVAENISLDSPAFTVSATFKCEGLPPFPKKDDAILTSNFEKPGGLPFNMSASWGVFDPRAFGWEGGSGPGVEIQNGLMTGEGRPAGSSSPYIVELDSHGGPPSNPGNSSMYRSVELHRGTYRFSLFYKGRHSESSKESNRVSVYLTGKRPVSAREQKLTIAVGKEAGWQCYSFDFPVNAYSIYIFEMKAEGKDDTSGGVFNDLKIRYVGRPGETAAPPAPGTACNA